MPEDLLKELVANRVDYHFARINHSTDTMTGIFKEVFDAAPAGSAAFHMQVRPAAQHCSNLLCVGCAGHGWRNTGGARLEGHGML